MDPATAISVALMLGRIWLAHGPQAVRAWKKIFSAENPTEADWDVVLALPWQKSYDDYVSGKNPGPTP